MPDREQLQEFAAWCDGNITSDEKGRAQILLEVLSTGRPGVSLQAMFLFSP